MVEQTRPRRFEAAWEAEDRWPWLAWSTAGLVAVGGLFAVLGLPQVPFMWPLYRVGLVLPTCGLTRAGVALLRGQPSRAWMFNPAVYPVASAVAAMTGRWVVGAWSGRWLRVRLRAPAVAWVILAVGGLGGLWIRQQAHASLLIHQMR